MDLITPSFGIIFWQTVTLLAVILILGKFAWKPMLQILNERENNISKSLQDAEKAKEMVVRMKEEQVQLLERIAEEEKKIILEAINSKNSILATANIEAKKITESMMQQAKKLIQAEKALAFDKLKQEVALLSIQIAEKLLIHELSSKEGQEVFMERLVEEMKV